METICSRTEVVEDECAVSRLELHSPANLFRAPFPYIPIITPAKQCYKLQDSREEERESSFSGCKTAERVFLNGSEIDEKESAERKREEMRQRLLTEARLADCGASPRTTANPKCPDSNNRKERARVEESSLKRGEMYNGGRNNLNFFVEKRQRWENQNRENSETRENYRYSRWFPTTNCRRLSATETVEMREGLTSLGEDFAVQLRRRSAETNRMHTTWMLPSEAERSWNKSPRPIAELIDNYEKHQQPKNRSSDNYEPIRLSKSSRIPVSALAGRYMNGNIDKDGK